MEKKITTHIEKGILISLILCVVDLVGHFTKIYLENWFMGVSTVLTVGAIIWSVLLYGKQMNNDVTFGNLFAHGFKTTAVITCIMFVYTLLSAYVIFPDFIDQVVEKGLADARKQGTVSEEDLSKNIGMIKNITTITIFAGVVLGELIIVAIASLIGAAVAKKNPQTPFSQPQM